MTLTGVETIEKAAALIGGELLVYRTQAAPLKAAEFYFADLTGCEIVHLGKVKGWVKHVCTGGQSELLEVGLTDGTKVFIPFLEVFIGEIDIEAKRVEIKGDWIFS